jgi:hypothetical protein
VDGVSKVPLHAFGIVWCAARHGPFFVGQEEEVFCVSPHPMIFVSQKIYYGMEQWQLTIVFFLCP